MGSGKDLKRLGFSAHQFCEKYIKLNNTDNCFPN